MIYSCAFRPDGKRIAVGGNKKRVLILDTATLREIATVQVEAELGLGGRIDSMAFAPDGKTLALQAEPIAIAPDGKRITLPHQSLIWLYDLSGREPRVLASLESTDMGHYGCVFSPDGKAFASFGKDGTIRLWDLSSPKPKVKAVFQAKGLLRGRSPRINTQGEPGRLHWPDCYSAILAGAGIRGGMVYGESDRIGAYVKDKPVRPQDFGATIYHAMGVPLDLRLGRDGVSRPITTGQPILDLFG